MPVARQAFYADASKTSIYKGASEQDTADIQAGKFIETTREHDLRDMSLAQIKQTMIDAQANFQAKVTADAAYNPWKYYGTRWNGTAWTAGGVN